MTWFRDPAWQEGLAILLVMAGAIVIYRGAAATEPGGIALLGVALFGIGIALPLVAQAVHAHRAKTVRSEDV